MFTVESTLFLLKSLIFTCEGPKSPFFSLKTAFSHGFQCITATNKSEIAAFIGNKAKTLSRKVSFLAKLQSFLVISLLNLAN